MAGLIVAIGLPVLMRLLDMVAPKDHHLKIVDRYAVRDDHPTDPTEDTSDDDPA